MRYAEIVKEKTDDELLNYVKSDSFIKYVDSLADVIADITSEFESFRKQAIENDKRIQQEFADLAAFKASLSATQRGGEQTE